MLASAFRGSLWDRMVGAALLDEEIYEYVRDDRSATGQAVLVVLLGTLAAGIGALPSGAVGVVATALVAAFGWAAYAYVAYWVATRWFKAKWRSASRGELLRTLGFAAVPRLLLVLGALPLMGGLLTLLVFVWLMGTTIVAVGKGLNLDIWRAMATASVSWLTLFSISLAAAVIVR